MHVHSNSTARSHAATYNGRYDLGVGLISHTCSAQPLATAHVHISVMLPDVLCQARHLGVEVLEAVLPDNII